MKKENKIAYYGIEVFIADDGTEFFDEKQCRKYEGTNLLASLRSSLPNYENWFYCEEAEDFINLKDGFDMIGVQYSGDDEYRELLEDLPDWFHFDEVWHDDFCCLHISSMKQLTRDTEKMLHDLEKRKENFKKVRNDNGQNHEEDQKR